MGLAREKGRAWASCPLLLLPRPHSENPASPPGATLLPGHVMYIAHAASILKHSGYPPHVHLSLSFLTCTGMSCPDHWPLYPPSMATSHGATWDRSSSRRNWTTPLKNLHLSCFGLLPNFTSC